MNRLITSLIAALIVVAYTSNVIQAQPMTEYNIPQTPTFQLEAPQRSAPPDGALITPLNQNGRAPFSGVLYNAEANAWLVSELQRLHTTWRLEAETELKLMQAWSLRELERLHNIALHNEQALNLQISSLEQDVTGLTELNASLARQTGWTRGKKFVLVFTSVGSIIVGTIAGWLIGTFAHY
jgi:hypothetical protein